MMKQRIHETRLAYLLRVAISHIREHAADCVTEYDGTDCDGSCLADELQNELEMLPGPGIKTEYRPLRIGEKTSVEMGDEVRMQDGSWRPTVFNAEIKKDFPQYRRPMKSPAAEFMAEHMPDDPLPELCPICRRELRFRRSTHQSLRVEVDCQNCGVHAIGEDRGFAVQNFRRFIASKKPRYEILQAGALTQEGDEFQEEPDKWVPSLRVGRLIHKALVGSYRRPIKKP